MKRILTYYMALLAAVLMCALPSAAQETYDDVASVAADSLPSDTLGPVQHSLPWAAQVAARIDRLLDADMFATSQVGMMVYDLDADSAIYARGERQLMRPASTMKAITAIAAIDKLGGSYQFRT